MDELNFTREQDFTLIGFVCGVLLIYLVSIIFAIKEYRKWNFSFWILAVTPFLIVAPPFIWLLVAYPVRRILRKRKYDFRLIQLKFSLTWFVVISMMVANPICTFICRHTVARCYSDELALCCSLTWMFVFMVFAIWMNKKLNILLETLKK